MEENIKEAISIIETVRKSMPECANKAFLKGALNELNKALQTYDANASLTLDKLHECERCKNFYQPNESNICFHCGNRQNVIFTPQHPTPEVLTTPNPNNQ